MAFVANFTESQTLGIPDSINITDTSVGTDANIVARRVYFKTSLSNYLVKEGTLTTYEPWVLVDTSKTFQVLKKDYALLLKVDWVDATGVVLYSKEILIGYKMFNSLFKYQLTQALSGNPMLINDNNFLRNRAKLGVFIDNGDEAILFGNDIFAAQVNYEEATKMRLQGKYLFNINI
jgi:hypothetical protein